MYCFIDPLSDLRGAQRQLGVPVFSLGVPRRQGYPLAILRLVRLLRRERVGIVHSHFFYPTIVALIAARLAGARFVFTRHHSDHNIRIGKRWHTRVDALCGRWADQVLAVSEVTRRIMIDVEHVPGDRVTTVYNGMDPLREPEPESVERIRNELALGREPVCLMIARLHEEKGHRFLFEALPEIMNRVGPVTVLLAGDGPHQELLERDVRSRGLERMVRFLGRRREIPELISLANVIVLPSLAESFGFAIVEAMSLGKPVVVSETGGMVEIVNDGEHGLVVPQRDPKALADAISRILEDPRLADAMGAAGRERAAFFSFERMIRGYEAVYSRLV